MVFHYVNHYKVLIHSTIDECLGCFQMEAFANHVSESAQVHAFGAHVPARFIASYRHRTVGHREMSVQVQQMLPIF